MRADSSAFLSMYSLYATVAVPTTQRYVAYSLRCHSTRKHHRRTRVTGVGLSPKPPPSSRGLEVVSLRASPELAKAG
jgi:hypothetical protein